MVSAEATRGEYHRIVRDTIRPLSLGFGLFIGWQAITGYIELSGMDRVLIAGADTLVALYLLGLAGFMWFKPPPMRQMNAWGASVGFALGGTDMVTMAVRGHVPTVPATLFVLAGIGIVVLSWVWVIATQASLLTAWYGLSYGFADNPTEATFLIQIATILGLAIHWGRVQAYGKLIRAREREHNAKEELQGLYDELERFSAVVAHDLKNPITAIRLKLRAMRSRTGDQQVEAAAIELDRMAKNMNTLIEDLLAYAKAGADIEGIDPTTMDAVASEVVELLQDAAVQAGGAIRIDPLPHFEADRTLLRQLLQNLVGNSITHRGERRPEIVIGGSEDVHAVRFWVQDNGPGFDPKRADELFQPFQRGDARAPGHGLGLATCARIVERLGGTIEAATTPGVGSRFTIEFPKEEEREEELVTA